MKLKIFGAIVAGSSLLTSLVEAGEYNVTDVKRLAEAGDFVTLTNIYSETAKQPTNYTERLVTLETLIETTFQISLLQRPVNTTGVWLARRWAWRFILENHNFDEDILQTCQAQQGAVESTFNPLAAASLRPSQ